MMRRMAAARHFLRLRSLALRTRAIATPRSRVGLALVAVSIATSGVALAKPSPRFTAPSDASAQPAVRYAALTQDACEAELTARKITFTREVAKGVRAPVRVTGAIHGVVFRTDLDDQKRATSA